MNQVPIVRTADRRMGIIGAIVFLLITLFLLFFFTFTEPDPPKVTVPVPVILGEKGITDFEVNNAGGGAPSENTNPVPEPEESPKEQPTQEEESPVTVPDGSENSESDNAAEEESSAPNPFSGNGSEGSGDSGSGGGFGSDDGPGSGSGDPGRGAEGERVRLANIHSQPKTPNDERTKIAFKLTVDAQGKVLRADVIRSATTTSNQRLIDEVIGLVKKEVKYKKKPGARNEIVYYTVTVQPG